MYVFLPGPARLVTALEPGWPETWVCASIMNNVVSNDGDDAYHFQNIKHESYDLDVIKFQSAADSII